MTSREREYKRIQKQYKGTILLSPDNYKLKLLAFYVSVLKLRLLIAFVYFNLLLVE